MSARLEAGAVKARARELGADLVGIAPGAVLDANPPDPARAQTPARLSRLDSKSAIVLGRRTLTGLNRLRRHDDRHKQYAAELIISDLEEIELRLVYFLEEAGFPSITVPPVHFDPHEYRADGDTRGPLSLPHAATEAGLGTLGLNLMLLTPEFGPRVVLGAVLTSAVLTPDRPLDGSLCLGEACGRCLLACPADAIGHWTLDKPRCAPLASPHGFHYVAAHMERFVRADPAEQLRLLKSKESFMAWQSILRGVGVYSGCTRCVDVCPVGQDYAVLADAQDDIPERTPEKAARLAAMAAVRERRAPVEGLERSSRWINGPAAAPLPGPPANSAREPRSGLEAWPTDGR